MSNKDGVSKGRNENSGGRTGKRKRLREEVEESFAGFSKNARDVLMTLKKRKKDPFDSEYQEMLDNYVRHVQSHPNRIKNSNTSSLNLAESGFMVEAISKLYAAQVEDAHEEVIQLAAYVTRTAPPERKRRGRKKIEPPVEVPAEGNELQTEPNSEINSQNNNPPIDPPNDPDLEDDNDLQIMDWVPCEPWVPQPVPPPENPNDDDIEILYIKLKEVTVKQEKDDPVSVLSELNVEESNQVQNQSPTKSATEGEQEQEPKTKRKYKTRNEIPPLLSSCLDFDMTTNVIRDDKDLPLLRPFFENDKSPVKRTRKSRLEPDQSEVDSGIGSLMGTPSSLGIPDSVEPIINDKDAIQERNIQEPEAGPSTSNAASPGKMGMIVNQMSLLVPKLEKGMLSPEAQLEVDNYVRELHYMSMNFGISGPQLKEIYKTTIHQFVSVLEKHQVVLDQGESSSQSSQKDFGPFTEFQREYADQLNASAAQANLQLSEIERRKSTEESKLKFRDAIKKLQKSIVGKYLRWHMIEENTPEFFMRVKTFEQRMKKIVAEEENKEEFDVRKYEKEVLEDTVRENLERGSLECELLAIASPPRPYSDDDASTCSPLSPKQRSDSLDSLDGETTAKWVPVTSIFTGDKNLNPTEVTRRFYTVLSLLSFENLEMNYDNLHSQESEEITKSELDTTLERKYSRGVKILSSRCPDIDLDEVYIAPLTSTSRTQEFRQQLLNENPNMEGEVEGFVSENKKLFVEEPCESFKGFLFGKRNSKKKDSES